MTMDNEQPKELNDEEVTYRLCLKFYKENEGKTFHVSYATKLRLIALTQQVANGPLECQTSVMPLGALDVIGRDRRSAWASLGAMSRCEAQRQFVAEAEAHIPYLKPYLEAHFKAMSNLTTVTCNDHCQQRKEGLSLDDEQERKAGNDNVKDEDNDVSYQQELQMQAEVQSRRIQDALNRRTFEQFKSYAEQQFPSNPDQQALLIRQLQEQHYQQYMQQTQQRMMETKLKESINENTERRAVEETTLANNMAALSVMSNAEEGHEDRVEDDEDLLNVEAASLWTRKDIVAFKTSLKSESDEATLKIDHGETVTVRVPTHRDGSAIFFEFATDNYDIGFGLFFEFHDENQPEETEVSVHVADSDEDDDLDEEDEENDDEGNDPECGSRAALVSKEPPTTVIIPLYRRDSHLEVYAGTHAYPGKGVYLLKFDNSYSLWRSKTLFYRVYYTK